jgi:hypothetical protein
VQLEYGNALVRNGNFGSAVAVLQTVDRKQVPASGTWRYCYNLAYGLFRLGQPERARVMAAEARKYAADAREGSSLDRLMAALAVKEQALPSVEGVLESMECGTLARLHVRVSGEIKIFVIPDPRHIAVSGGSGQSMQLQCGPQKNPAALRIEYQAMPGGTDVAGLVRSLEFK